MSIIKVSNVVSTNIDVDSSVKSTKVGFRIFLSWYKGEENPFMPSR